MTPKDTSKKRISKKKFVKLAKEVREIIEAEK